MHSEPTAPTVLDASAGKPVLPPRFKIILVSAAALMMVGLAARRLTAFFDVAGLIVTLGGTTLMLILSMGIAAFRSTLSTLIRGARSEAEAVTARCFLRQSASYALGCGFLGSVLGMMLVLMNLADLSQIGPGLSLALLSQVYGVGLALAMSCIGYRWERGLGNAAELEQLTRRTLRETAVATGAGTVLLLAGIIMMYLANGMS